MDSMQEAKRLERTAVQYCTRGMHYQAADLFTLASAMWGRLGASFKAGECAGQAIAERRQLRPAAPVNRAALVD